VLTIDTNSDTWAAVTAHCHTAHGKALTQLAEREIPERDADFLRGKISLCAEILALKDKPPMIEAAIINNFS
jgi:hypothetical protein